MSAVWYLEANVADAEDFARDALWYAYESISLHAVNDTILRTGMRLAFGGAELLEAELPICQREVAFQLECLRLVQL